MDTENNPASIKFTTDLFCMGELNTLEVEAEVTTSENSLPDRHDRGNVYFKEYTARIVEVTVYDAVTDRMSGVLDKLTKGELERLEEMACEKAEGGAL